MHSCCAHARMHTCTTRSHTCAAHVSTHARTHARTTHTHTTHTHTHTHVQDMGLRMPTPAPAYEAFGLQTQAAPAQGGPDGECTSTKEYIKLQAASPGLLICRATQVEALPGSSSCHGRLGSQNCDHSCAACSILPSPIHLCLLHPKTYNWRAGMRCTKAPRPVSAAAEVLAQRASAFENTKNLSF